MFTVVSAFAVVSVMSGHDASSSNWTAKRQRTALGLRGSHHVIGRALATVARNIRLNGLPEATSRSTLHRQRVASVDIDTSFGKLIQERELVSKKGGTIRLPFLHPAAMLWVCC